MSGKCEDWISGAVDLPRHPRFLDFICELDIDEITGLGLLVKFWSNAFRMFPDGDLSSREPRAIARMTGWRKDAVAMYDALKTTGFLDENDCIHDWESWGGKLHYSRKKEADKKAAQKNKAQAQTTPDVPGSSPGVPREVGGKSSKNHRVESREEREEKDQEIEKKSTSLVRQESDGFDSFWRVYPRKESRKKALARWSKLSVEERRLATGIATLMGDLSAKGLAPERNYILNPLTFLNGERWEDWRDGPPANWCNVGGNGQRSAREASLQEAVARYKADHPEVE